MIDNDILPNVITGPSGIIPEVRVDYEVTTETTMKSKKTQSNNLHRTAKNHFMYAMLPYLLLHHSVRSITSNCAGTYIVIPVVIIIIVTDQNE
jgi:hypothetical protein